MGSSHNGNNTYSYGNYQENQVSAEERSHVTLRCLQELDLDIMEAFVVKEVEAVELHVACYGHTSNTLRSWER